jgi:SPW repeat
MLKWRRESALDLYKFILGAFVFVSPWLFAFVYQPARVDAWVSGIAVMVASIAALTVFVSWEEWLGLALGLWMAASPWVLTLPHAATKVLLGAAWFVFWNYGCSTTTRRGMPTRDSATLSGQATVAHRRQQAGGVNS